MARPKHKTERLEIRLTPAQKDAVRRLADAAGVTRTAVITAAVASALEKIISNDTPLDKIEKSCVRTENIERSDSNGKTTPQAGN